MTFKITAKEKQMILKRRQRVHSAESFGVKEFNELFTLCSKLVPHHRKISSLDIEDYDPIEESAMAILNTYGEKLSKMWVKATMLESKLGGFLAKHGMTLDSEYIREGDCKSGFNQLKSIRSYLRDIDIL